MGDHRLPKRFMSGELEDAGKRGPGGGGEVMDGLRGKILSAVASQGFGGPPQVILASGTAQNVKGGCRFMAAWVNKEEKSSKHQQRKMELEEVGKIEVAAGVTVASLRRFKAPLIGPTQGLLKRRRLCR